VTPELRAALRLVVEAHPTGSTVGVLREHLLDLLDGTPAAAEPASQETDYTVAQVAKRFGRDASTVRLWIRQGAFTGAYLFRQREWRIPAAVVLEYEAQERAAGAPERRVTQVRGRIRKPTSLSAWRHRHDATTPQPAVSAR
jgi:transposase-like protein